MAYNEKQFTFYHDILHSNCTSFLLKINNLDSTNFNLWLIIKSKRKTKASSFQSRLRLLNSFTENHMGSKGWHVTLEWFREKIMLNFTLFKKVQFKILQTVWFGCHGYIVWSFLNQVCLFLKNNKSYFNKYVLYLRIIAFSLVLVTVKYHV